MKRFADIFKTIPERVYLMGFVVIIILTLTYSYIFYRDAAAFEQRIATKQKELIRVLELKEMYLSRKLHADRFRSEKTEQAAVSLGLIEELVAKTFISGKMNMLKPSILRQEKGKSQQGIFELKVGGATLKEVIAFVNETDARGLFIKKLQVNIQASNPSFLDMYVAIIAG